MSDNMRKRKREISKELEKELAVQRQLENRLNELFHSELATKDSELELLENTLANTTTELERLKNTLATKESELELLKTNTPQESELERLETTLELERLEARVESLETDLAAANEKYDEIDFEEIHKLDKDHNQLKEDHDKLKQQYGRMYKCGRVLQQKYEKLLATSDATNESNVNLRQQTADLEVTISQLTNESNVNLRQQTADLEATISQLTQSVATLKVQAEASNKANEEKVDKLEETAAVLEARAEVAEETVEVLETRLYIAEEDSVELRAHLEASEETVEVLEEERVEVAEEELHVDADTENDASAHLNEEARVGQASMTDLRSQLAQKDAALQQMIQLQLSQQETHEHLQEEVSHLQQQSQRQQQEQELYPPGTVILKPADVSHLVEYDRIRALERPLRMEDIAHLKESKPLVYGKICTWIGKDDTQIALVFIRETFKRADRAARSRGLNPVPGSELNYEAMTVTVLNCQSVIGCTLKHFVDVHLPSTQGVGMNRIFPSCGITGIDHLLALLTCGMFGRVYEQVNSYEAFIGLTCHYTLLCAMFSKLNDTLKKQDMIVVMDTKYDADGKFEGWAPKSHNVKQVHEANKYFKVCHVSLVQKMATVGLVQTLVNRAEVVLKQKSDTPIFEFIGFQGSTDQRASNESMDVSMENDDDRAGRNGPSAGRTNRVSLENGDLHEDEPTFDQNNEELDEESSSTEKAATDSSATPKTKAILPRCTDEEELLLIQKRNLTFRCSCGGNGQCCIGLKLPAEFKQPSVPDHTWTTNNKYKQEGLWMEFELANSNGTLWDNSSAGQDADLRDEDYVISLRGNSRVAHRRMASLVASAFEAYCLVGTPERCDGHKNEKHDKNEKMKILTMLVYNVKFFILREGVESPGGEFNKNNYIETRFLNKVNENGETKYKVASIKEIIRPINKSFAHFRREALKEWEAMVNVAQNLG